MGIPAPGTSLKPGQSTFSDDVLRIELCGPDKTHFSVIDVPGIFRTPTEGVTTKDDMSLVRGMVHRYIENSRTIILAVVPANVDIATQEILNLAAEVDPKGQRTLGVLTKPDLVDKGAEYDIMDLVRGKRNKLNLGYCVVRNRGQQDKDKSSTERHKTEREFFKTQPWSSLGKDRVGISALSPRLRDLLSEITRREFPIVTREIARRLTACEEELSGLGPSRETPEQQRRYLLDIAVKFREVTSHALEARYGRSTYLKENTFLRLATILVDLNSVFSEDVENRGHTVEFNTMMGSMEKALPRTHILKARRTSSSLDAEPPGIADESFIQIEIEYPELCDVLPSPCKIPWPQSQDILVWIERAYRSSRGFELGTFDPSILTTLFQEQSQNWEGLAMRYISLVISSVHRFCDTLLKLLCTEERVKATLWSFLLDELLLRYRKTADHVKFILQTERAGTLLTTNHFFSENLEKARSERIRAAASDQARPTPEREGYEEAIIKQFSAMALENVVRTTAIGNIGHTVRDIHDILNSYYKVARKRFVDTVCMQATDYHLVTGPDTPLGVFSSGFVVDLTNDQLEMIAGEDKTSIQRRRAIAKEIESLMEGRRILTS
jgi:hypothetical protein